MTDQRLFALHEKAQRVIFNAKRMKWIKFVDSNVYYKIGIQVSNDTEELDDISMMKSNDIENSSRETISDNLYKVISYRYPHKDVVISISFDGDNELITQYNT